MTSVTWVEEAEAELLLATKWYEERVPGLGARSLLEVDLAAARIAMLPRGWSRLHRTKSLRRKRVRSFPWTLLYVVESSAEVAVLALHHTSRRPSSARASAKRRRTH